MGSSPRVLHVLEGIDRGGAEILVLDVLRYAVRNELPIFVASLRGGDLEQEFLATGRFFRLDRTLPLDLTAIVALRKLIRKLRIDVVHGHQPVDGLHGYLAVLGTDTKVVLTFHGDPSNQKWKDVIVARFLIPRVDCNVAVSTASRDAICKSIRTEGKGKWSVVHNGIDPERLVPHSGNLRRELGLPRDAIVLGMVGNFQPGKDQLTLVRAFREIVINRPDVHLVLVGGKSKHNPFMYERCVAYAKSSRIESHVHFTGPREDAVGLTAQFDGFVFATVGDTYALALVEALMQGVPCIVARTPAMVEISGGEDNVNFFEPSNVESLALQLWEFLNNRERYSSQSLKARQWARSHHHIEKHVQRLLELYDDICCDRRFIHSLNSK